MFCTKYGNSRQWLWRSLALAMAQIVLALLIATSSDSAIADEAIIGNWHGQVLTPAGPLAVIVTVKRSAPGTLEADFQVPSQAPGEIIPTEGVLFDGQSLSFRIPRAAASWSGTWMPEQRRFEGTFSQGMDMQLDLEPGLSPTAPLINGLDGRWTGTLDRNGTMLRLALNVQTTEMGTFATLDSPDMGATGLPVSELSRDNDLVQFKVPVGSVTYTAKLNHKGNEICGDWIRPGQSDAKVCLKFDTDTDTDSDGEAAARKRPQEPGDDVPYERREVRFVNSQAGGFELAGTLTVPEGHGPFPAAVLISGSGPQDRDETFMGHKPFLVLADHLTRNGVAVLRYDDRGFGESGGDHWSATTKDFATDASAAVEWLALQPEIRSDAIGLIGHSEGGLVAPISALQNPQVSWVVLLAAPGVNMIELIASQTEALALTQGVSKTELAQVMPINRQLWRTVAEVDELDQARMQLEAMLTPEVLTALGANQDRKPLMMESLLRPWTRYLLRFDPAPFVRNLKVPVLAINGSLDVQVPAVENLAAMRSLLADHPDATVIELPDLNHLFQTARTGALGEYRDIEETMAPLALATISDWIVHRYGL